MEGLVILCIIYWLAFVGISVVGIIQLIANSSKNKPVKPALKLLIISAVMLVIGVGTCGAILSSM